MRLLDVGCGWGSMAIHAAQRHGVSVVGITLSKEQQAKAEERVAEAGLEDLVEIRLQDYRAVADGPFDAISSIGMFEHVGMERTREYLVDLRNLLVPGGRLLNHAISRPEPSSKPSVSTRSFIGRYVFPDAALLEVGTVVSAMQDEGLEVRDVQSLREHYARTLRAWVANLEAGWDEAQMLAGPGRARVWRLYMAASRDRLRAAPHLDPPGAGGEHAAQRHLRHARHPRRHRRRGAPRPHLDGLTPASTPAGRRPRSAQPRSDSVSGPTPQMTGSAPSTRSATRATSSRVTARMRGHLLVDRGDPAPCGHLAAQPGHPTRRCPRGRAGASPRGSRRRPRSSRSVMPSATSDSASATISLRTSAARAGPVPA